MIELHAFVSGDVHGVGFRATTKRIATDNRLVGFVKNLEDGRVEFIVQGDRDAIETFLDLLQARFEKQIDAIELSWEAPNRLFPIFEIVF